MTQHKSSSFNLFNQPAQGRRDWLKMNAAAVVAASMKSKGWTSSLGPRGKAQLAERSAHGRTLADTATWEKLAQQGVDAARSAGASYADVRITRQVVHIYRFGKSKWNYFELDSEVTGIGIRALVNGYWGFSASPRIEETNILRLAQDAVAQAKENALGPARTVDFAAAAPVRGTWTTPMRIDPFSIPIEEKHDYIGSWIDLSNAVHAGLDTFASGLSFARQERTIATSDGSVYTQRVYESGGTITCDTPEGAHVTFDGLHPAGAGWEIFLDADIPAQIRKAPEQLRALQAQLDAGRPALIGRYTVVCDGATMASLIDQTIGLATQLDRALGYEANASGTSYLDDPLAMVGTFQVASPLVTVTANRSVPTQLATVKWDDEGIVPQHATLVKDGILQDFQTTREQAAWLAPYYARAGRPAVSNGYAASETALKITMQQTPNLAMMPNAGAATLDDLVAGVSDGILVTGGMATSDFQARNGILSGEFRRITNGQLGPLLTGGAFMFNTSELWKKITMIAGAHSVGTVASSQYPFGSLFSKYGYTPNLKGQPPQLTGHTVTAPAATIAGMALIDPTRKG